jgi:putative tryptophan/tyrosine transport system substrate-binding protein
LELQPAANASSNSFGPRASMAKERVGALLILSDVIFNSHGERLAELAVKSRLPTVNAVRESVEAGGLMSYGPSFLDSYRRSAAYVDKILKGAKAADLPVEQPTEVRAGDQSQGCQSSWSRSAASPHRTG